MKIHKVGIIGLGNMGQRHVDIVHKSHVAELTAVADIDRVRADNIAEQYGCRAFYHHQELLDQDLVDMVMICTPDSMHVEPTLACAAAGKPTFLEKPIATSLEDADTILNAVKAAGILFTVGHCLRFDPKYVAIKNQIDAGTIGEIVSFSTRRQNRTSSQEVLKGRVSSQQFLGVHDYDILNWFLGKKPISIYCESVSRVMRRQGFDIDDISWTTIRYEDGTVAVTETGWLLPKGYPLPYRFELTAYGDVGTAHLEVFDDGLAVAADTWTHLAVGDRLTPQLEHFLSCIETGKQPLVSGQDARLALEMALAAEASASAGQRLSLPLTKIGRS